MALRALQNSFHQTRLIATRLGQWNRLMVVVLFLVLTVCDETFQFLYSQEVTCYSLMRLAPHCGHAMMCFFGGLVSLTSEPSCTILEAAVVQEKYGVVNDLGFQDGGTHFSVQGARVLPVWELGSVTLC